MFPFLPSHPRCCPTRFGLRGVDGKGNERLFVFSAVLRLSFSLTFASCVPRDAQEYTPVVPDTYVSFDILLRLRETDINPFKATVWNTLRWEVKGRCLWSRVSWSPPASIHLFPFGMMKSSLLKFPRLTLTSLSDPSFFFLPPSYSRVRLPMRFRTMYFTTRHFTPHRVGQLSFRRWKETS